MLPEAPSPIGRRIVVVGNTSSGKSTLAERLARALDLPFVELDALNWEPGWHALNDHDPDEFRRRIREATAGDAWVVAGNYSAYSRPIFWDRVETVVWLDPPLPVVVSRVLTRSWRRWRSRELLWDTNYERFFPQRKGWHRDSLVWWAVTSHRRRRREAVALMSDPRYAHVRFIRLTSGGEADAFARSIEASLGAASGVATPDGAR